MRCVIWPYPCSALLLDDAVQEQGEVTRGWVVNGAWNYQLKNGKCLAKDGDRVVTSWDAPEHIPMVVVPPEVSGGYNKVIEWAEKQLSQSKQAN